MLQLGVIKGRELIHKKKAFSACGSVSASGEGGREFDNLQGDSFWPWFWLCYFQFMST